MKDLLRLICLVVLCFFVSCNEDTTGTDSGKESEEETSLQFRFTLSNPEEFAARADSAALIISGTDLKTMRFPLTITDSTVEGTITELLAGEDRLFTIEVYDGTGKITYNGSITLDVDPGSINSFPIIVSKVLYGRELDSLALIALDNASQDSIWNWSKPLHEWPGVTCGTTADDRVTEVSNTAEFLLTHVPDEVKYLTEVTKLNLRYGTISKLPENFKNLKKLTHLYLGGNTLSAFPEVLLEMPQLQELMLESNNLKSLPTGMEALSNLTKLDLSHNELQSVDNLPKDLTAIKVLVLNDNMLTSLTENILTYSDLEELYVNSNALTALPEIGTLTKLLQLKAGDNNITEIPLSIAQLEKLTHLEMQKNALDSVPYNFDGLKSLQKCNLSNNRLRFLAYSMKNMQTLQELKVEGNKLQFGELEFVKEVATLTCDPQDSVGTAITLKNTSPMQIGIRVSGGNNLYRWFRDGKSITGQNDSLYVDKSGVYTCIISNSDFKNADNESLKLNHRPITVEISDTEPPVLEYLPHLESSKLIEDQFLTDTLFSISDNVTAIGDIQIVLTKLPVFGTLEQFADNAVDSGFAFSTINLTDGNFLTYTNHTYEQGLDSLGFKLVDFAGNESAEFFMKISFY